MNDADAKQYAENRLKEIQKGNPTKPMTQIVTSIIRELWQQHKYAVMLFGKPLDGVGVDSNGLCSYSIRGNK